MAASTEKSRRIDLIVAIIVIIIAFLVAIFFIALSLLTYSRLQVCQNNQSPYCFQFSCVNPGPLCGDSAIRYSPDGSTYYCSKSPLSGYAVTPPPV